MSATRVLITGATGFIGSVLLSEVHRRGLITIPVVRRADLELPNQRVITDIGADTPWHEALTGVDCVVHLAGRVHVMSETAENALDAYRRVNVAGSEALARAAAAVGVRRLIYISSIKVNGERTAERPFHADDVPQPQDDYGVSKHEAERALRQVAQETGLETVIIRPPLVYGPGVKGNFARLTRLVQRGAPLPFASVNNRRSLVSVYNLCDLIACCVTRDALPDNVLLVSDGEDLSTAELIRRLAAALGRPARLLAVPPKVLEYSMRALGRSGEFARLCGSLQVDIRETCALLDWRPPVSIDDGLARTVSA